jgi:diadenosine tetraphosphate (Ap4A) HIT family hydrolase
VRIPAAEQVERARRGRHERLIGRLRSGWLCLGSYQFLPGYCVLLADPVVESLNALDLKMRARFLLDMAAVGDALLAVTSAWRINYAVLGNGDPTLHAHLQPRYLGEAAAFRRGPVDRYDAELIASVPFDLERDRPLIQAIRQKLEDAGLVAEHN